MEENKNIETQEPKVTETPKAEPKAKEENKLSLEEQVQQLMLENARIKKSLDKAASEASNFKKQLREKQSADEIAMQEKAEKELEREEQFNQLLRENNINKLEKSYLSMGYTSDEASRIAIAEVDNDFEARIKIMAEADARKKKSYEAEWLKSRPEINVGVGDEKPTMTKEQFDKASYQEIVEFKRQFPETYKQFMK